MQRNYHKTMIQYMTSQVKTEVMFNTLYEFGYIKYYTNHSSIKVNISQKE